MSRLVALHPSICHFWSLTLFGSLLCALFGVVVVHRSGTTMAPNNAHTETFKTFLLSSRCPTVTGLTVYRRPQEGQAGSQGPHWWQQDYGQILDSEARAHGSSHHPRPEISARATIAESKLPQILRLKLMHVCRIQSSEARAPSSSHSQRKLQTRFQSHQSTVKQPACSVKPWSSEARAPSSDRGQRN